MASPARPLCVVRRPSSPAAAQAAANRRLIWVIPSPITNSAGAGDSAACSRRTEDDLPVHSFRTLLTDLGTLAANTMQVAGSDATFTLQTLLRAPGGDAANVATTDTPLD